MKLDAARLKKRLAEKGTDRSIKAVLSKPAPVEQLILRLKLAGEGLVTAIAILKDCAALPPTTKTIKGGKITKPLFHHGDLIVGGNLQVSGPLFVTGNMIVNGVLSDSGESSYIAIGGGLAVHSLWTDGDVGVGDIDAKGIVYGYYNDRSLVCGEIRALIVIADEHDIQHAGVKAKLSFEIDEYEQGFGRGVTKKLQKYIKPAYFREDPDDDKGRITMDVAAVFAAIEKRKDPFLAGALALSKAKDH